MATLTKEDIKAIRGANDVTVHLNARHPSGLVQLVKRRDYNEPFSEDRYYTLTATATLYGSRGKAELERGEAQCFGMAGIYWWQNTPVACALKTLRVGDEVHFEFCPDHHTNGYLCAANLHGDTLQMLVYRDSKRVATWEIETSICPSNSARMCKGIPDSDSYAKDAEEARKIAA